MKNAKAQRKEMNNEKKGKTWKLVVFGK